MLTQNGVALKLSVIIKQMLSSFKMLDISIRRGFNHVRSFKLKKSLFPFIFSADDDIEEGRYFNHYKETLLPLYFVDLKSKLTPILASSRSPA